MSKAKNDAGRDEAWLREHGFTLDAEGKMIPAVNNPGDWRELAFAPMPKGMLTLVPRRSKEGIQAADVPDCSISLPSVKAELLRFMEEADIRTPEAAAKWRAVFVAAHLDECLLEGITDQLARRCTIRAILHLLGNFSTFVKASEGKMSPEAAMDSFRSLDTRVGRIEDRLTRCITPPANQAWWQNLLTRFENEPGLNKSEKWRGVARMVVMGALTEQKKPTRERRSDYLTPRMLNSLIAELQTGSKTEIEKRWAVLLSGYVRREAQKAKKRR